MYNTPIKYIVPIVFSIFTVSIFVLLSVARYGSEIPEIKENYLPQYTPPIEYSLSYDYSKRVVYSKKDIKCLATNIYFEARDQSIDGQQAVANVTLNRVAHKRWPSTICEVVWQRRQFSWTHDGKSDRPREKQAWKLARFIALDTLSGDSEDVSNGALHYHADYVNPFWNRNKTKSAEIEKHIFYK